MEIGGRGGDQCGHRSWIVGLVGDEDGWVSMGVGCGRGDRCGLGDWCGSGIVGLGFVFTALVGGGVFLGFREGGWLVVEVEIGVAVGLGFMFTNLALGEFGFMFVVFFFFLIFLMGICRFIFWI